MRDFRNLRVWERAHHLALEVNELLAHLPRRGFTHVARQAQRAALSISANIVEGCGHDAPREFSRYLRISLASANELEYHLLAARDLGLLALEVHRRLESDTQRLKRMLVVLLARLDRDAAAPH